MERTSNRRKTTPTHKKSSRKRQRALSHLERQSRYRRRRDDDTEEIELGHRSQRDENRRDNGERKHLESTRRTRRSRRQNYETQAARKPEEYRSRRHRRGPSVRHDEDAKSYNGEGRSMFGEHAASRGAKEYAGSNKRHPGLLGSESRHQTMNFRNTKNEEGLMRKLDEERLYRLGRKKRPRNHHNSTRQAISDYDHRRQFGTPFHPMQMYDPIESEYEREEFDELMDDDHIYRYEGYQHSGSTEGFGGRQGERQQGRDWLDEDEYPEGHATRHRGYGKYGSR